MKIPKRRLCPPPQGSSCDLHAESKISSALYRGPIRLLHGSSQTETAGAASSRHLHSARHRWLCFFSSLFLAAATRTTQTPRERRTTDVPPAAVQALRDLVSMLVSRACRFVREAAAEKKLDKRKASNGAQSECAAVPAKKQRNAISVQEEPDPKTNGP